MIRSQTNDSPERRKKMKNYKLQLLKVGGAMLDDADYLHELAGHIKQAVSTGARTVLVHGGGKEVSSLHRSLKVPFDKSLGLRVTSKASMELVTKVLCGSVNKRVVAHLNNAGLQAMGVCGADLGLMKAEYLNRSRLGQVGGPPEVNAQRINQILSTAQVLVISPVCLGPDGELLNVNADSVAQSLAIALGVDCLDFVTDVANVRTSEGETRQLASHQVEALIRDSVVEGGMIPKLQASVAALLGGVGLVRVGNLASLRRGLATEVSA